MTLKTIENGVERDMAPDEEAAILADWAEAAAPAKVRAQRWEDVKAIRDRRTQQGGYKVVVGGVDKWFHSDIFSRTQQLGLKQAGAGVPAVPWKTMDGSFVVMSEALAGQVFTAAVASDMAVFAHAEQLRAELQAADDPATVDIQAGWPAAFGGAV